MVLLAQKVAQPLWLYRGCVSVGAVGTIAPTLFSEGYFAPTDFIKTYENFDVALQIDENQFPTLTTFNLLSDPCLHTYIQYHTQKNQPYNQCNKNHIL